MARKTAALQKRTRRKKKVAFGLPVKKTATTSLENRKQNNDEKEENVVTGNGDVEGSSAQLHDLHTDECDCFIRRGQMFLPASLLDEKSFEQDGSGNYGNA